MNNRLIGVVFCERFSFIFIVQVSSFWQTEPPCFIFLSKLLLNLNDFFEHAKRRIVDIENFATVVKHKFLILTYSNDSNS